MNLDKTRYMVIGGSGYDLYTDRGTITQSKEYKYLGVTITAGGKDEQNIRNKIGRPKTITRELHPVLWDDKISNNTERRMFTTFVESTLWCRRMYYKIIT